MFRSRWIWPTVIGLVLGLLVLIYGTSGERYQISVLEGLLRDAVSPLQNTVSSAVYQVKEVYHTLAQLDRLQEQNIVLRQNIARLSAENAILREAARENRRWAALFEFKQGSDYSLLAAKIVGRAIPDWFNVITINKGELDGVTPGMSVISTAGVVGQVRQVTANTASVLLALDSRSAIGGITEESRDYVLVEGCPEQSGLLRVKPLASEARLEEGALVMTSGLGQVYPKGLPIGEIVQIEQDQYGLTVTGLLQPATDFARLEEVFVILPD